MVLFIISYLLGVEVEGGSRHGTFTMIISLKINHITSESRLYFSGNC